MRVRAALLFLCGSILGAAFAAGMLFVVRPVPPETVPSPPEAPAVAPEDAELWRQARALETRARDLKNELESRRLAASALGGSAPAPGAGPRRSPPAPEPPRAPEPPAPSTPQAGPATPDVPAPSATPGEPPKPGKGTIVGRVLMASGLPARGIGVDACLGPGDARLLAETDESGCFRLADVAPGAWMIQPDEADPPNGRWPSKTIDLKEGEVARVSFGGMDTVRVRGRAVDSTGAPQGEATLHLQRATLDGRLDMHSTQTDRQGGFLLENVEPGEYRWTLIRPGESTVGSGTVNIPKRAEFDLDLRLSRLGVEGVVLVMPEGRPVGGVSVCVWALEGGIGLAGFADAGEDGRFRIEGLSPGEYMLGAWAPGYASAEAKVTVREGAAPGPLRLELVRAALVPVRVTDASGNPVSGKARVAVASPGGDARIWPLELDSKGDGTLDALGPGDYSLELQMPGYKPASRAGVRLNSGANAPLVFVLEKE